MYIGLREGEVIVLLSCVAIQSGAPPPHDDSHQKLPIPPPELCCTSLCFVSDEEEGSQGDEDVSDLEDEDDEDDASQPSCHGNGRNVASKKMQEYRVQETRFVGFLQMQGCVGSRIWLILRH